MAKETVLAKKARESQLIYADLTKRFSIDSIPTTFIADERREKQFMDACRKANPYPFPLNLVLLKNRKASMKALFEDEKIVQTPAIAAALAACSSLAAEIGGLRGDDVAGAQTYCDVAYAGMQAIRLFMMDYDDKKFAKLRGKSSARVKCAFDGTCEEGKFKAKDGRYVSFHVYYQSQQKKLVKALNLPKPSEKFTLFTRGKDKKLIESVVSQYDAQDLEELAFDCGATGCMLRNRQEWESTDVGKAIVAMPLARITKETESAAPDYGKPNSRGPLSGIKVLDLTHIIAGPVCSRLLAEYGADVLLVRRGKYIEQEQTTTELDGWAGKNSIQLDFNIPEQLARVKELIKRADVITYSYQNGALDKFGLSEDEIRKLNPNVIYSNIMCFSDTVWKQRPGWAPLAEDITGLSIRNGSAEQPKNLNGVPLDYFPGMLMTIGTLKAIAEKLKNGGGYKVTASLSRGAQYLHDCSDICENPGSAEKAGDIAFSTSEPVWDEFLHYVSGCAIPGRFGFPAPATVNTAYPLNMNNMRFTDGNTDWKK
jgi:crotonobetainyl-CoA:carnitine CoA-transferase CaiB-like acyl-CoA transferase